jgi:hypothetical protein
MKVICLAFCHKTDWTGECDYRGGRTVTLSLERCQKEAKRNSVSSSMPACLYRLYPNTNRLLTFLQYYSINRLVSSSELLVYVVCASITITLLIVRCRCTKLGLDNAVKVCFNNCTGNVQGKPDSNRIQVCNYVLRRPIRSS